MSDKTVAQETGMIESGDEVINQGDGFRVFRHRLGTGEQLPAVLQQRGITSVYKGDQNELWDGALTNGALAAAVAGSNVELDLFVHDEKMGTADARLLTYFTERGLRFVLSEDYFGRNSGAVWVHQDISYGPFYSEVVSPAEFEHAAVNMRRAAELWQIYRDTLVNDADLRAALLALGVALDLQKSDHATQMGPAVNREVMEHYFTRSKVAQFFYLFTKSIGYYGVAPVFTENISMSSIPVNAPELLAYIRWLFVWVAVRGALRLTPDRADRKGIIERARRLATQVGEWMEQHPDASLADWQSMMGDMLVNTLMVGSESETPAQELHAVPVAPLERSSRIFYLRPEDLPCIKAPLDGHFFYFDLALRYPEAFTEAYNEALNKVGFGLQRIKYDPEDGRYTPPYFVELRQDGVLRRYNIEISHDERERATITLGDNASMIKITGDGAIQSAYDFLALLFSHPACTQGVSIIGKAAPLAAELQRLPRSMAMPRQGSKYVPMLAHLNAGLRRRGVQELTPGSIVRIASDSMSTLAALGDRRLRLPPYLSCLWGRTEITAAEMAATWRERAGEARQLSTVLGGTEFWQHVHLVKLLAANSQGRDVNQMLESDARLRTLIEKVTGLAENPAEARELLVQMGKNMPAAAGRFIDTQLARREELLRRRAELKAQTPPEVEQERLLVEYRLLLVWAAYVRLLSQQAEALSYLNDRPYFFSFYLTFGPDIVPAFFDAFHFDLEYTQPLQAH